MNISKVILRNVEKVKKIFYLKSGLFSNLQKLRFLNKWLPKQIENNLNTENKLLDKIEYLKKHVKDLESLAEKSRDEADKLDIDIDEILKSSENKNKIDAKDILERLERMKKLVEEQEEKEKKKNTDIGDIQD